MTRAELTKDPAIVAQMFDEVAPRYDRMNSFLSCGQAGRWRTATVKAIAPRRGERILDVAAGTGTSTAPLAELGAHAVAVDMSQGMLAEGRRRHPAIDFRYADGSELPFADNEFAAVTISFALRNFQDPAAGLREMFRVLAPGGRFVLCEFSTPTVPVFRHLYNEYLMRAISPMAHALSSNPESYSYLAESIRAWPDQAVISEQLLAAGFDRVQYRNLTGGIVAIHRGYKPAGAGPEVRVSP